MKLISFSLWGDNPKYTYGIIENVLLRDEIYPGWNIIVFHDETVPKNVMNVLRSFSGLSFQKMSTNEKSAGMYWRFLPISYDDVDVVIVRDADSRLNIREKAAVEEWLESDKLFHIMRDHKVGHRYKIMGGMFGAKKGAVDNMEKLIEEWGGKDKKINYKDDETFLEKVIYPKIEHSLMVHASSNKFENHAKDFPKTNYDKRASGVFIPNKHPHMFEKSNKLLISY